MPNSRSASWRKDIDGLRGLAVLLVVFSHLGISFSKGGFVGVDVFFVISGFLITRQLANEYSNNANKSQGIGSISLLGFYLRRVRRILPASLFVIFFFTLFDFLSTNTLKATQNAVEGIWAAFFLMNWHLIFESTNYFQLGTEPSKFLHFWSLAVEEQYYFVAPVAFIGVVGLHGLRIRGRKIWWNNRLEYFFATIAVSSFVISTVSTYLFPKFAYFSTFTRAWQIALGAFFAIFTFKVRSLTEIKSFYYSYLGLFFILGSSFLFSSSSSYPGFGSLFPTIGACLLLIAGETKSQYFTANKVLESSVMRYFGRISFSLYLIHWPIIVLNSNDESANSSLLRALLLFSIMTIFSQFVYSFIETPFRKIQISERWLESKRRNRNVNLNVPFKLPRIFITILLCSIIVGFIFLGLYGGASRSPIITKPAYSADLNLGNEQGNQIGSPNSEDLLIDLQRVWKLKIAEGNALKKIPKSLSSDFSNLGSLDFWEQSARCTSEVTKLSCIQGFGPLKILVTGDSHARMLDQALKKAFQGSDITVVGKYRGNCKFSEAIPWDSVLGTPVTDCQDFRKSTYEWIKQYEPALVIVAQANAFPFSENGKLLAPEEGFAKWSDGLRPALEPIANSGSKLLLVGQVPGAAPLIECVGKNLTLSGSCFASTSSVAKWNSVLKKTIDSLGGTFLNITDWICVNDRCPPIIDNEFVLMDGSHMSDEFAAKLAPLFRAFIKQEFGFS